MVGYQHHNSASFAHGVQHKYTDTALLLCNEVCGAYCRYCFRKRLFIDDNDALTSLEGLNRITSVGGYLNIQSNAALTSVEVLNSLTSVGGYFEIVSNDGLTSLEGLNSLTSIGGNLAIYASPALCQSLVDAFVSMLESWGWSDTPYTPGNADC